jgi:hypothetical protein
VLGALAREKRGHIRDERHLAQIEQQQKIFQAELERMIAEGIEDEPQSQTTGRPTLIRSATTGREYTEWVK